MFPAPAPLEESEERTNIFTISEFNDQQLIVQAKMLNVQKDSTKFNDPKQLA